MKVNRPHRFVASEKLLDASVQLVGIEDKLWRVMKLHYEGLTPKERAYVEETYRQAQELRERNRKLQHRLMHSCGRWWGD